MQHFSSLTEKNTLVIYNMQYTNDTHTTVSIPLTRRNKLTLELRQLLVTVSTADIMQTRISIQADTTVPEK